MLIIVASILSSITRYDVARQYLMDVIAYFFNSDIAVIVSEVLVNQPNIISSGVFGLIILIISGTAALTYMQDSLNQMMDSYEARSVKGFLRRRIISLGLLFLFAIIIVLLILSATFINSFIDSELIYSLNYFFQIVVTVIFLAFLYKYLPNKKRTWKQVLKGSIITGTLLMIGKILLELYLVLFDFNSFYGVASYSIITLIWIYVSMIIIFLGAIIIALDKS